MIGVILQVRLGSSRLPGKALLKLADLTVTEHCLRALGTLEVPVRILATDQASARELGALAQRWGWDLFVGSADDVLDRYVRASRGAGLTTIIRATGDNPLVSAELAQRSLEIHLSEDADYTAIQGAPLGSGVEVVAATALERAWAGDPDAYEREHVNPYLYRRPEVFRILKPQAPQEFSWPQGRLTLDTREDYEHLQSLFHDLYRGQILDLGGIVPWLKARS